MWQETGGPLMSMCPNSRGRHLCNPRFTGKWGIQGSSCQMAILPHPNPLPLETFHNCSARAVLGEHPRIMCGAGSERSRFAGLRVRGVGVTGRLKPSQIPRDPRRSRSKTLRLRMRFSEVTQRSPRWKGVLQCSPRGRPAGDQVVVRYALVTSMISSSGMSSNEA